MASENPNTYRGWIEAFTIFNKYEPEALYPVQPDHDIVYSGPSPAKVSEEDKARLVELGWGANEDLECFSKFT